MNGTKSKEKGLKSEEEISGLSTVLKRLKNRMLVGNLSPASIISYSRANSNYRILKVTRTPVTFKYLDRKKKSTRIETITGVQFILRFLQHVLPKGFTKIRHYGFLSSRSKGVDLPRIRKALKVKTPLPKKKLSSRGIMIETQGKDPYLCPKCQEVEMVVGEIMHGIRGSPMRFFAKDKKVQLV